MKCFLDSPLHFDNCIIYLIYISVWLRKAKFKHYSLPAPDPLVKVSIINS